MRLREGRGEVSSQSSPRTCLCGMLWSSGVRKVTLQNGRCLGRVGAWAEPREDLDKSPGEIRRV